MSGIDLGFGRVWGDRIRVRVSVGIDLGLGCVGDRFRVRVSVGDKFRNRVCRGQI